jgi:hypothetical protein
MRMPKKTLSKDERKALTAELASLIGEIGDLERQLTVLDFELAPMWLKERSLRQQITASHQLPRFNPANAAKRAPWFEGLLQLAIQYGPRKMVRSRINSQMGAKITAAKRITLQLDKA